jgi:uncharacterized protein (TIGR03382 family)
MKPGPALFLLAFAVGSGMALRTARADDGSRGAEGGPPSDEATSLAVEIDEAHTTLSTDDCAAACRALASIRRAADRLCALEPGPRCDEARTKEESATERVRSACPDCALAAFAPQEEARADAPVELAGAAPERGGCASCRAVRRGPTGGSVAFAALAAWATAWLFRRRRRTEPHR